MEPKTVAKPLALLSALASLMLAPAPSARTPIGSNTVCADGTCCPELNSICIAGGQEHLEKYWYPDTPNCLGS